MVELNKSGAQEEEDFRAQVVQKLAAAGINVTTCRDCGEPIIFLETTMGKWQPLNMALESHFSDCPARDKFRKSR